MKCPKCNGNLLMGERKGIEIDYCNDCRGIWLDAGELDKIVERSRVHTHDSQQADGQLNQGNNPQDDRQESWWDRITDFFD